MDKINIIALTFFGLIFGIGTGVGILSYSGNTAIFEKYSYKTQIVNKDPLLIDNVAKRQQEAKRKYKRFIYLACRDLGGTHRACKHEAAIAYLNSRKD